MDHGTGTSNSKANSPSSAGHSTSTSSPASLLERRNRRRSSALTGENPAGIPLTESDQSLASTIARINLQNAASPPPEQPVPPLTVPALSLADSSKDTDPRQPIDKTPTRPIFRILSSQRTDRAVVRSHVRNGSRATTTFHLFDVLQDKSGSKTPTQQEPKSSPITTKPQTSPAQAPAGNEESPPSSGTPPSDDSEVPQLPTPRFQLSPRFFTQRMFTSSPLEHPSAQAEDENTQRGSPPKRATAAETPNSSDNGPPSPCEPFPAFEPCPPFEED